MEVLVMLIRNSHKPSLRMITTALLSNWNQCLQHNDHIMNLYNFLQLLLLIDLSVECSYKYHEQLFILRSEQFCSKELKETSIECEK